MLRALWIVRRRRAWQLLLLASLPCLVAGRLTALSPPLPPLKSTVVVEEATPDCDLAPIDTNPAEQRKRLLARLGVDGWHAAGFKGRGVKIAVLDSGFRGYRDQLGKILPAHVTVQSFRADGDLEAKPSQHGILCAEVLHALAPEAELLLVNWDANQPQRFLDAAKWAKDQGAKIISCSVIMPSWSDGDGGGPISEALAKILGPGDGHGDVLFFASAGNTAQRHWYGSFHDAGHGIHEWTPAETCNALTPWMNGTVSVELYWQPGAIYELTVVDSFSGREIGRSQAIQEGERCSAAVHFQPQAYCNYQAQVRLVEGRGGPFHVVVLGGGLSCATARGSIAFPADAPQVVAVAAVNEDGQRARYSSCGPNSRRPKPDLSAAVPFPSLWRPRPFTGTSAAAPQAAGLAALCWGRHADWTANEVRTALQRAAFDLAAPGHDFETGYGLIRLPREDVAVSSKR